jgi:hypothetical protein
MESLVLCKHVAMGIGGMDNHLKKSSVETREGKYNNICIGHPEF